MPKLDKRVDAYIRKSPDFAKPILERLRAAWHKACPGIEETIKWGVPYFVHNGLVGGMAAFKSHVSLGFWRTKEMRDPAGLFGEGSSMSASRIHGLDELPPEKVLLSYIREAVALNKSGAGKSERKPARVPSLPADFRAAMQASRKALASFEKFPPSQRKEYIEWITEAKQAATRERRIVQAVEWLAEGKPRNWKYMKKP